jgi:hypothetical protein
VSITEGCHDTRRLLCRVYDDHQPAGGTNSGLEETLTICPRLPFSVIGRLKCSEDGLQMRLKLRVPIVRIQDVQRPSVLE